MANLAVRVKLPAMNIRMAVRAVNPRMRKDEAFMALCAGRRGMRADQRKTGGIMVESQILS